MTATTPIPKPKGDPFIGNLRAIDAEAPIQGFMRMAKMLGPIFQLEVLGNPVIFVGSQALVDEVSSEVRFT